MPSFLATAGETVAFDSALPWVSELIAEGAAGELQSSGATGPSIRVCVEAESRPFATHGWEVLARGAWRREGEIVVENAATAGFDLHVRCSPALAELTYRWRPPARDRLAARLLRSRFHLLARAVLMQYPALWWAGTRGRAPLHASACTDGAIAPLLTGTSGVGRSTLVLREVDAGGQATGDNLAVGDGKMLWGLVEPLRVEGGGGRRMPHGRNEWSMRGRVETLAPDRIVVLRRAGVDTSVVSRCSTELAARSLVANTYSAGELRRYWSFAAVLGLGTGVGPVHPPVEKVAAAFAGALPSIVLQLGHERQARLADLVDEVAAAA